MVPRRCLLLGVISRSGRVLMGVLALVASRVSCSYVLDLCLALDHQLPASSLGYCWWCWHFINGFPIDGRKNHKKNLKADVFKIKMIYNFNAFLCLTWSEKFRSLTSRYQQNLEITRDIGGPQLKLTCTGHEPTPSTGICNIRSLVWKQFHIQLSLFLRFPVIYNNPTLCLP